MPNIYEVAKRAGVSPSTVSSRVPLDSPAAAVTAFAVGALLMATGSALAQKVSVDSSI